MKSSASSIQLQGPRSDVEPCVLCGREQVVKVDPEAQGYVHLSEVSEASARQRIEEIRGMNLRPSSGRTSMFYKGSIVKRLNETVKDDGTTIRDRLHPAVFDTYYRPRALEAVPA